MATDFPIIPLYRYQRCPEADDQRQGWIKSVLKDHRFYFPSRQDFNDPFDCIVPTLLDTPSAILKRFVEELVERKFAPASEAQRAEMIAKLMSKQALDGMRKDLQKDVDGVGILSLSKVRDDILMWAHYADSHKGLCFEFDGSANCNFFGEAQPVIYGEYRPIPLDADSGKQMERMILTKSPHWSYEQEFRIVRPNEARTSIEFPVELLTGVIFGCRMPEGVRNIVKEWAHEGRCQVAFFEARPKAAEFGLDIIRVD
jgi:hypothetical protein